MDFNTLLYNLNSMGFYDFVLPWILFLMIFFAIVSKAPFLPGERKKQFAMVIAAILAFFAVNYPINGIPLGTLLSGMFGWSSLYIAGLLVIILFVGMAGFKFENLLGESKEAKIALGLVLVLLAIIVLGAAGFPIIRLDDTTWTLIFVLVLIGAAVLFVGGEEKKEEAPAGGGGK